MSAGSGAGSGPAAGLSSEVVAKVMATALELDGDKLTVKECYPLEVRGCMAVLVGARVDAWLCWLVLRWVRQRTSE
jgi:hypothetical protein